MRGVELKVDRMEGGGCVGGGQSVSRQELPWPELLMLETVGVKRSWRPSPGTSAAAAAMPSPIRSSHSLVGRRSQFSVCLDFICGSATTPSASNAKRRGGNK